MKGKPAEIRHANLTGRFGVLVAVKILTSLVVKSEAVRMRLTPRVASNSAMVMFFLFC